MTKQTLLAATILALSAAPVFAGNPCTPPESLVDVGGGKNACGNIINESEPFGFAGQGSDAEASPAGASDPGSDSPGDDGGDNGEGEGPGDNGEGEGPGDGEGEGPGDGEGEGPGDGEGENGDNGKH